MTGEYCLCIHSYISKSLVGRVSKIQTTNQQRIWEERREILFQIVTELHETTGEKIGTPVPDPIEFLSKAPMMGPSGTFPRNLATLSDWGFL